MSTMYGMEKSCIEWARDAPPRYSQIDEETPLVAKKCGKNVKQILGIRRSSLLLTLYVIFYAVYLITGGLVFTVLEEPEEEDLRVSIMKLKAEFLQAHPCITENSLEGFIEKVVSANSKGISILKNDSGESNWSFGQSLFFSSTIVTTIGYGHITPLSTAGKVFCIIYAALGIPLTLMLLTALVERLMVPSTSFLQFLNSRLGHLYSPFFIRVLHLFVIGIILVGFFFLVPAGFFTYLEPNWDFMDAIYYCFVTLTTIGLGDYIPGDSPHQPYRQFYKIGVTVYLILGLTYLIFTLTVFYEIQELNLGLIFLRQSDWIHQSSNIDPEKVRLQTPGLNTPKYTQRVDEEEEKRSSRNEKISNDESSSGDETTPVHAVR